MPGLWSAKSVACFIRRKRVLSEENKHFCLFLLCPRSPLPKHLPVCVFPNSGRSSLSGCPGIPGPCELPLNLRPRPPGQLGDAGAARTLLEPPCSSLVALRTAGTAWCRGAPHGAGVLPARPAPPLPHSAAPAQLPAITCRLLPPPTAHLSLPPVSTHSPPCKVPLPQDPPCSPPRSPSTPRTPASPPPSPAPVQGPQAPAHARPPATPGPGCRGAPEAGACAAGSPAGKARRKSGAAPAPAAPLVPSAAPAPPPPLPSPRSCGAAPGCRAAAAAGGGTGAAAAAAAGPRRSGPPSSVGSARDGAGREGTGVGGGRHRGRCGGRCGGGNRARASRTAHRGLSIAHRVRRTRYRRRCRALGTRVLAAAQRGTGSGSAHRAPCVSCCTPAAGPRVPAAVYRAPVTAHRVPGTPGTTCHTPSTPGTTHHAPGARYQVLGATHCALHDDTMRLAAGTGVAR